MQLITKIETALHGGNYVFKIHQNGNKYVVTYVVNGCSSWRSPYIANSMVDAEKYTDKVLIARHKSYLSGC